MIDLETALAQQKDLRSLCRPREIEEVEIYWSNASYGFAEILKEYGGYPLDEPVWAIIPHGVYFRSDRVFPGEAMAPVPAVFSYPEYVDLAFRKFTNKRVIPSASPFLYALAMFNEAFEWPKEREGTILFPKHSTAVIDIVTDWQGLLEDLDALPDELKPITVCIHWQDYERGYHRAFERKGYRLVSAGHFGDQQFVYRLLHLLSQHRYAASNDVASNLLYAVAAGVPYFLVGAPPEVKAYEGREYEATTIMPVNEVYERVDEVRRLFLERSDTISEEQKAMVDYQLGASRFKSRDSLLMDLHFARNLAM